jgi:hypothetical protein
VTLAAKDSHYRVIIFGLALGNDRHRFNLSAISRTRCGFALMLIALAAKQSIIKL